MSNVQTGTEISIKKWLLGLLISLLLSIALYFLSVLYIFNPDFKDIFSLGMIILQNLGSQHLKFKAYIAVLIGLMPISVLIVYFFIHNTKGLEDYGSASFAKEKDFPNMDINDKQGLMLGCLYKKKTPFNKKDEIRYFIRCLKPLACLIVAPPGTGKTASIALPNLFSIENSVVVLDIKGELYQKSAGYRQQNFHHRILRFSPLNPNENTMYFNPFDRKVIEHLDYVELKQLADQIAGTIFVGEKGKENDHWITSAKTMFSFYATYFMQKNKHTTLGELAQAPKMDYYDLISDELKEQFTLAKLNEFTNELERDFTKDSTKAFYTQVSNDESLHTITRNQAKAYITAAEQEFASIKSTYDTFMAVFQNPRVENATSTMSFDFYDLREEKISCYIVIQSEDIDILAPLIRIFVETMFKKLMSGKENSDPNKFIYFIGDEFVRFGKMPYLLEAPALCRSYGLIPIYITQSYEQIKKYYGEDDLNILRSNVGYQVIFTMNSTKDAEELSKMIGKYTRKKISRSQGNLDFIKSSDSTSSEGYELVPAQDILNMPNTEILILIRGFVKHPIKAQVNFWFKNPQWQGADKIPVKSEEELQQEQAQEYINANSNNLAKMHIVIDSKNRLIDNNEQVRNRYIQNVIDPHQINNAQNNTQTPNTETTGHQSQQQNSQAPSSQESKEPQTSKETQESKKESKDSLQDNELFSEIEAKKQEFENTQDDQKTEQQETKQDLQSLKQDIPNALELIQSELGSKGKEMFIKYLLQNQSTEDYSEEFKQQKLKEIRELLDKNKIAPEIVMDIINEIKDKQTPT